MALWRALCLDVWVALGGNGPDFETWMDEPRRTNADAWAQLMAAVRGDWPGLFADTNPPAGQLLDLHLSHEEG